MLAATMCGTLGACVEDGEAGGDKAAEDDAPVDGKTDSFARPTEHDGGAFGAKWRAEISADERYHLFTFRLAGKAELDIRTFADGDGAVDTVAYLYRRAPGASSWGRYVERNDDAGARTVWSRITHDETSDEATEYAVIIKGYTRADVGRFALVVDCAGDGCSSSGRTPAECRAIEDVAAECEDDTTWSDCLMERDLYEGAIECCEDVDSTLDFCGDIL